MAKHKVINRHRKVKSRARPLLLNNQRPIYDEEEEEGPLLWSEGEFVVDMLAVGGVVCVGGGKQIGKE